MSLALDVEVVTLAEVPVPEAVLGSAALVSQGAAVFAPLIPYATPAPLAAALKVMVIDTVPLDDQIAYQVSACLRGAEEKGKLTLRVHVKVGDEVTVLTVTPPLSAVET